MRLCEGPGVERLCNGVVERESCVELLIGPSREAGRGAWTEAVVQRSLEVLRHVAAEWVMATWLTHGSPSVPVGETTRGLGWADKSG